MTIYEPTFLQDMAEWISDPSIPMYGRWDAPSSALEGGVDLASPGGTPVYALATGPIVGLGDFWHGGGNCLYQGGAGCTFAGGVVTTRINVPGYGANDLYYQHIQLAPGLAVGQTVQQGQLLGTINPAFGEVEMGFNADWGGVWGASHPAPWVTDPRPLIAALMSGNNTPYTGSTSGSSGSVTDPLSGVGQSILTSLGLPSSADVANFAQQFMLIFFGGLIILIGVLVVFFSQKSQESAA
ncbi:MAG: hypothetical protein ACRETA_04505 [Gammaproteobacteria bacterium]